VATYLLLHLAYIFVAFFPDRWVRRLFLWVGELQFRFSSKTRAAVLANLSRVLPEATKMDLARIAKGVFRHGALNYYDLLRGPRRAEVKENLFQSGQRNYLQAQELGRGVIIATAHLGSINLFLKLGALSSWEALVLVEEMRSRAINEFFSSRRSAPGIETKAAGYEGLKAALRCLRKKGTVVIACDRAIQGTGLRLPFMGEETLIPVGAVELALRTGAPIVPAFGVRAGEAGAEVFFEPPIIVNGKSEDAFRAEGMRSIVKYMESYIRRYPDQWVVFSPVWGGR